MAGAAGLGIIQGMANSHLDHERPRQERVKCVVVGDSGVGKTRLICARARNAKFTLKELCHGPHVPTVWAIDQYHQHQEVLENSWEVVDDVSVTLRLWDTFGCHDKDRKFAYGRSDVVALCFSVCSPASLRHVAEKWMPEIRHFCPKTPVVLIGCRNDMRHLYKDPSYIKLVPDERRRLKESDIILPEKGRAMAAQIGAVAYYETSVFSGFGVRSVFSNAIRAALLTRRQTRFWASHLKHVRGAEVQSPYLVPPPPTPNHHSIQSTFLDDLANMIACAPFPDVELICGDDVGVQAHAILLASASLELHNVLSGETEQFKETKHPCFNEFEVTKTDRGSSFRRLFLRSQYSSESVTQLVRYLYTAELEMSADTVQPLLVLSQHLGVKLLTKMITTRLSGDESDEDSLSFSVQFLTERNKRLAILAFDKHTPYSDVTFEVSDGLIQSFRGLMTKRSSFMCVLFCGHFEEESKHVISIADIDQSTLRHCLYYLYLDQCPKTQDMYEAVELLAAADRFCLLRLMDLVQDDIVKTYLNLPTEDLDQSRSECVVSLRALELLEVAEAFNAGYLYSWCCNFITTHYVFISRVYLPQLRSLTPLHQAMLSKQRWPPIWYVDEFDLYEQSLDRRRHEMLQVLRRRRSRFSFNAKRRDHSRTTYLSDRKMASAAETTTRNSAPSRAVLRWRILLCSR